ncbi:MAG: hypothetical protein A2045_06055 [Rhodocyclales bacterium GWA2_65_20]|nr:MAG: hypothetical protein A2045_06055 [Rhodocyclales bacterium GWA2_65_20]
MFSLVENLGYLLVDHLRMATAATAQEYRVVLCRQPADQRPVPDLFLRDEGRWQRGVDDVDIDPRNMIGDQQGTRNRMRQVGLDLDTECIEQGSRPTGLECQTLAVAAQRENAQRKKHPADYQQGDTKYPESANR